MALDKEKIVNEQKEYIKKINEILIGKDKKVFINTYGCQQNVSDSEMIMDMACQMGYKKALSEDEADLIVFNTCAVRENAELKVYGNIGALKHKKAKNPDLIIAVCGCMMQQKEVSDTIKKKYKHVDLCFGTHSLYYFPSLLYKKLNENQRVIDLKETNGIILEGYGQKRESDISAWVSIMYGCNNFCTYCIVPYVRGRERSRKKEDIINEVKFLAQNGYKEITLLGQNVNSYGKDLDEKVDFSDLLDQVAKIEGIKRIRFVTSHPKDISEKLLNVMAKNDKVCKQLHLPIQSGNNHTLKEMNRGYTKEDYLQKINLAKKLMPSITLTTDIIVGFPGETKEEFNDTIDILKTVEYDSIFSFIYSKRRGTKASKMEDKVTSEEKKEMFNHLLNVQDEISLKKNKEMLGKTYVVLCEGESKTDKEVLFGRTEGGKIVNFKGDKNLYGKFVKVEITDVRTWSLIGKFIESVEN